MPKEFDIKQNKLNHTLKFMTSHESGSKMKNLKRFKIVSWLLKGTLQF